MIKVSTGKPELDNNPEVAKWLDRVAAKLNAADVEQMKRDLIVFGIACVKTEIQDDGEIGVKVIAPKDVYL